MKLVKRKKGSRFRGSRFHGHSMHHKGKGNKGGKGMAGTGKRGDQKKTYVLKHLFPYFGKKGYTSKSTKRDKSKVMNINEIEEKRKGLEKEGMINLKDYKILGRGEIKSKLKITCKSISKTAKEKIEKAGGTVIINSQRSKKEKDGSSKHTEESSRS